MTKNLETTWNNTASPNTIFYVKHKTSDIRSLTDIRSFYLCYMLTMRNSNIYVRVTFFARIFDLFLVSKPHLQDQNKTIFRTNYLILLLFKSVRQKKIFGNGKNVKLVKLQKNKKKIHQTCRSRYHRYRHLKKKKKKNEPMKWHKTVQTFKNIYIADIQKSYSWVQYQVTPIIIYLLMADNMTWLPIRIAKIKTYLKSKGILNLGC